MVIFQRNEVSRIRLVLFLTLILSVATLTVAILNFSQASQPVQIGLVLLSVVAGLALIVSLLQLYTHPKRSQVILFQVADEIAIATNALHEGFKLRFLRDILGENVTAFSDEERERWKRLEADGFFATLCVRNVRKLIVLRLCTMIFDDVFVVDQSNRWEHHDSSSTAEPSFSKREMPPLTSWKSST